MSPVFNIRGPPDEENPEEGTKLETRRLMSMVAEFPKWSLCCLPDKTMSYKNLSFFREVETERQTRRDINNGLILCPVKIVCC